MRFENYAAVFFAVTKEIGNIIINSKQNRKYSYIILIFTILSMLLRYNNLTIYNSNNSAQFIIIIAIFIILSLVVIRSLYLLMQNIMIEYLEKLPLFDSMIINIIDNKKKVSIVEFMISKKKKRNDYCFCILFFAISFYYVYSKLYDLELSIVLIIIITFLILILIAEQFMLVYRVKRGLYGSSEYEAMEILKFILNNSSTIGTDGDNYKKILPDIEQIEENIKEYEMIGGKLYGQR